MKTYRQLGKLSKPIFVLFICINLNIKAQCPNTSQLWGEFGQLVLLHPSERAAKFDSLRRKCIECKFTTDSTYTNLLSLYANAEFSNGNIKKALSISSDCIRIANAHPESNSAHFLCKYYFYHGFYLEQSNQQEKAADYYKKSIKTGIKYPKRWSIVSQANQYLAYNFYKYGDYQKAIVFASAGISYALKANDTLRLLPNMYEKARSLYLMGYLEQAHKEIQALLPIADKFSSTYEIGLYNNLEADIYLSRNNYEKAIDYYEKSKNIFQSLDAKEELQGIYTNLHFVYLKKNNDIEASKYFQLATENTSNLIYQSRLYNNLAWSYSRKGNFKESFKNYQICLNILPIGFNNRLKESNPNSDKIKIIAEKDYLLSPIQDKADTWLDYYKATKTKSHLTNALKTYALADSMIDFMRYEHAGEGSKLFWRQKTRGMYERAIEASYLAGNTEAAFRFFEKSKAVLLADKLNELGANQQLPEADAKHQRTLRDSIANLQNQLASLPANEKKRQALQTRLERFNDDFETFRKNLEKTNPAYYHYKYDNSTPGIADFQKSLSGEGFISYFVGDSAVYAFTLTAHQSRLVKLKITPQVYQSTANEFLTLCANRAVLNAQYPRYQALAYALYEQLWKPLNITSKRVIISSDGVFLPFEALVSTPSGNEFLLKRHAISYTYSANFLVKGRDSDLAASFEWGNNITSRSFVGFAPEAFVPSLKQAPLNGSSSALEEISQGFWFGKNLTQVEATKTNFMRYAPNARVIQLFTHADADSTDVGEPKIYFQDAPLRLSELNQAERFDAQLLVLSACKTGIGQNQRGEGVFSLARGFAALGIPSTITTLWNVEDQPTYELTKLFYNYLDQGLPKDEALQRAKLDWLAQGGAADALPSQWAGMILVGDTAPLESLSFGVYGLGLLGLALLGGVWWWRKRSFPPSTTKMSRF